ncbi:SAM-dependent methyltransferase, partial [Acinetobacter baumannii]
MATNIYLLGSGILGSLHLTEETKQALQISKHIFVLNPDTSLIEDFKQTYSSAQVHDMAYLYKDELYRQDVYKKISEVIIATAKDNGPVSFIVHGHPLFLVSASEYTLDLAEENNLSVKILPGISSFDTLMCDLKIDYGYALQFFDSTTLINHNWSLNTEVPLLIFQLSTTNNKEIML